MELSRRHFLIGAAATAAVATLPKLPKRLPLHNGTNWYVDATAITEGNGSKECPFRTIQRAIDFITKQCEIDDGGCVTINVGPGIYEEPIHLPPSRPGLYAMIKGDPANLPVIKPPADAEYGLLASNNQIMIIEDLCFNCENINKNTKKYLYETTSSFTPTALR